MVNIIVYLEQAKEAQELVNELLSLKLVANASIDIDNVSYRLAQDDKIERSIHSVITAQTKSLLFSHIEKFIHEKHGEHIPIFSMPITQANHSFDHLIRNSTIKS